MNTNVLFFTRDPIHVYNITTNLRIF